MEYEFINDSLTGTAIAKFSMEHEVMGSWLEVEISKNITKLQSLLDVVSHFKHNPNKDITLNGVEYSLIFSDGSVCIISNADLEQKDNDSDDLDIEDGLNTNFDYSAECGIEDFEAFLVRWKEFIQ